MSSRHQSRRRALQILFQWDQRQPTVSVDDAVRAYYASLYSEESEQRPERDEFMEALVRGTVFKRAELDEMLERHSQHWRVSRMSAVDRNVLRLAAYEMRFSETPAAVVIDEAVELARRFSGDESVGFVNGVLDSMRREEDHDRASKTASGGE